MDYSKIKEIHCHTTGYYSGEVRRGNEFAVSGKTYRVIGLYGSEGITFLDETNEDHRWPLNTERDMNHFLQFFCKPVTSIVKHKILKHRLT